MKSLAPESLLVSAGRPESPGQPLNRPMSPASNYLLGAGKVYAREHGAESWTALEEVVGGLEGGTAVSFASGMAAVAAVFDQVPSGGEVVLPADCYQGVASLAAEGEKKGRWSVSRLPTDHTDAWIAALETADLAWVETPSNPQLILADLAALAAAPRKPGAVLAVDNTFATPLNQRPLALGADFSVHSATKYLGGHSDLLCGLVVSVDPARHEALVRSRTLQGTVPGTLESFLAARGVRTLAVRMERAQANALHLARFLEGHPAVAVVRYPGLESHPQHALAKAQFPAFGAIIAIEVNGGAAAAEVACRATHLVRHATSLGSVESSWERRAVYGGQEHVPPGLVRLSVGIEAVADLQADLDQALRSAVAPD